MALEQDLIGLEKQKNAVLRCGQYTDIPPLFVARHHDGQSAVVSFANMSNSSRG